MESFDRGEQVIASFLDAEKAFDNVWHNGLRYKIFQLGLPTKVTRWISDFLVGRVIQVKVDGFLYHFLYYQFFHLRSTRKQVFIKVHTESITISDLRQ